MRYKVKARNTVGYSVEKSGKSWDVFENVLNNWNIKKSKKGMVVGVWKGTRSPLAC